MPTPARAATPRRRSSSPRAGPIFRTGRRGRASRALRSLLPQATDTLDEHGAPRASGRPTGHAGLFFCGQIPSRTGQLREIGIEAQRIAALASR
jgi:hypothetical protein